jgi:hypothetical protein
MVKQNNLMNVFIFVAGGQCGWNTLSLPPKNSICVHPRIVPKVLLPVVGGEGGEK